MISIQCHANRISLIGNTKPNFEIPVFGVCECLIWRLWMSNEVSRIWMLLDRVQMQLDLLLFDEAATTIREILVDLAWLSSKYEASEVSKN